MGVSFFVVAGGYSQVCFLYEKEGAGFWVLGTGCLQRLLFHDSLCPSGHARYIKAYENKR